MTSTSRSQSWNSALSVRPGNLDISISQSEIRGSIPDGLLGGRLLSNGPGWNTYDNLVVHPFDGHGYIRSYHFNLDGSVDIKARFINTEVYREESVTNSFIYRGLGTNPSEDFWKNISFTKIRNVANTTVYSFFGRLIAGWEGGVPHALDPVTLETLGEETFDGLVQDKVTLAHIHYDKQKEHVLVVNIQRGRNTGIEIHELNDKGTHVSTRKGEILGTAFVHDFMFSKSWYIFGSNALQLDLFNVLKSFMGVGTLMTSLRADIQKPGELVLISRETPDVTRRIRLPKPVFVVHFVNAFERSDGTLIVDACIFHDFTFGQEFGYVDRHSPFEPELSDLREPQSLYRITVPPYSDEADWELLAPHSVDFPRVHPDFEGRETSYFVGATRRDTRFSDPFDSLIYLDLHTPNAKPDLWTAPPDVFVGEPIVAPDKKIGIDYVLVLLSDGLQEMTTLAIFEARDITKGPVCEIPMPLMPIAFHGCWESKKEG